jgi:homoserine O-succinyltransferase
VSANRRLRVGLINAMPPAARNATDRQFRALLPGVDVLAYRLPDLDGPCPEIPPTYRPFRCWTHDGLDALIVSGLEPPPGALEDACFWTALAQLLRDIRASGIPALLSCLASHAWLYLFGGLVRQHLEEKLSGVFRQDHAADHPLVAGLESTLFPHSRHNDIPIDAMAEAGCSVLLSGTDCGWTVGVDERPRTPVILVQGHPEYEADTLLREFRRDLGRWRAGELPVMPAQPVGYLDPAASAALSAHVDRLRSGADEVFPFDSLLSGATRPWSAGSRALTRAWLADVGVRVHA